MCTPKPFIYCTMKRHNTNTCILYMYIYYTCEYLQSYVTFAISDSRNFPNQQTLCLFTITGKPLAPRNLSATITESDRCNDNGCVVTVEWSEPFISCAGSVSWYRLSVTPPTCDCVSPHCMVVNDTAVYSLSGNDTYYHISINGTKSLVYNVTVRADTCDNTLTGELTSVYINLKGICIHMRAEINFALSTSMFIFSSTKDA